MLTEQIGWLSHIGAQASEMFFSRKTQERVYTQNNANSKFTYFFGDSTSASIVRGQFKVTLRYFSLKSVNLGRFRTF